MGRLDAIERRWSAAVPRPAVDPAFLDEHLAAWPELRDRTWTVLPGGLRSVNLRGDDVVLRVPLGDDADVAREAAVMRAVAGRVNVPPVLAVGERALVIGYVPHVALPGTAEAGRAAGRAAAAIHGMAMPRAGFLDAGLTVAAPVPSALHALHDWVAPMLAGRAGERLGHRLPEVRAAWDRERRALEEATARSVLVHADFKPTNVKWDPSRGDVVVFDWEFAWAGPALMDVAMLHRWPVPEPFSAAFTAAYLGEGGALPARWRELGALIDLFNLVAFLDRPPSPRRDADVLARVDRTLREVADRR